jgi:hypothetical protein
MSGTKIICAEHGVKIGGCNCRGAKVVTQPCNRPDHAGLPLAEKGGVVNVIKKAFRGTPK